MNIQKPAKHYFENGGVKPFRFLFCNLKIFNVSLTYISIKDKPQKKGFLLNQNIMARSTYISENLTQKQLNLLLLLDEYEFEIFTLQELKELTAERFNNVNELVENLVDKNLLSRIERGKYCRTNFRDELVIGTYLVEDGVIGYWTALNLHGLTEQFSNTVFIQTTKVKRPKTVFGVNYQFVKVASYKMAGVEKNGYGTRSFRITDKEKTLIDCFDLPHYSGGYAELIRAFASVHLSSQKMIKYCKLVNNIAATKRMGFLAEFTGKTGLKTFVNFAKQQVKTTYNLLDPLGPDTGKFNSEWKLRMNISEDELINIENKAY